MTTVDAYLERIGWDGPVRPDRPTLAALQLQHLRTVPFENLDVFAGVEVRVDLDWSLPKIVERRRGGWCFELNGSFAWLLRSVGFDVSLLSARVAQEGVLGPDLDHLALLVRTDGERWLVDVGFGDSPVLPLSLETPDVQPVAPRDARVTIEGDHLTLFERAADGGWATSYVASLAPHELSDFAPRSRELRTTPGLGWTTRRFATRATDAAGSRVWLLTDRLKIRTGRDDVVERPVTEDAWPVLLEEHFGMRV